MKDEIIVLEYLVAIPKYEGNKNLIQGAAGKDIQENTKLSPEVINNAIKYMHDNNWVNLIPHSDPNSEYTFLNVWITYEGMRQYLLERIDDWKRRISNLYALVEEWLIERQSYTIKTNNKINMYEELMKKYGIEKQLLDVADIFKNNKLILSIKPVGLWIIGANGRVDLITQNDSFMMVDLAGKLRNPKWVIFKSDDRRNGQNFSKEIFYELIGN